jgi:4-hydroxy-tetrahydrodipicolinate synthase
LSYRKVEGIIAATVTPLTEEGRLNLQEIGRLTNFLIEKGIHGIFPCGSTGEGVLLSLEERKKVAEITVKEAAGRVPVIVHTGSLDLKEALELTLHARDVGADGAALIPPYYYTVDDATILQYYSTVARRVPDFPLYVYNIPGNVKNSVSPKVLARLQSEYPHIVGIKDSSMDFMNFINFKQQMPEDFCILMGNDAQIYASLLMGGSGAVAATATVFPEPVVEIYESLKAQDMKRALKAQETVIKLRAIFRSYTPIAPYKEALKLRGIDGGIPHPPLRPLTTEESQRLRAELEALGVLS